MRALSAVFLTTVALVLLAVGWGLLVEETKRRITLRDEDVENQETTTHCPNDKSHTQVETLEVTELHSDVTERSLRNNELFQ